MEKKILVIGDIFGELGLQTCAKGISEIRRKHKIDFVIANGENSAKDGRGLDEKSCQTLFEAGVDLITTGNHVWRHEKFYPYLQQNSNKVLRPANYPSGNFGKGYAVVNKEGFRLGVINLQGRVFMKELSGCPFREADSIINFLQDKVDAIIVDFHAEATSEKQALGFYLDGRISLLFGTHTHVQTADNRILPKNTAFITDIGFCGAINSCIGVEKNTVINQYLSQMPARFRPELTGPFVFSAGILSLSNDTSTTFLPTAFDRVWELYN